MKDVERQSFDMPARSAREVLEVHVDAAVRRRPRVEPAADAPLERGRGRDVACAGADRAHAADFSPRSVRERVPHYILKEMWVTAPAGTRGLGGIQRHGPRVPEFHAHDRARRVDDHLRRRAVLGALRRVYEVQ